MPIMQNLLYGIIWAFIMLFFMLAFLSLVARRLRDAGFSAWLVSPAVLMLVCMLLSSFLEIFNIVASLFLVFFSFYSIILLVMCIFPTKEEGEVLLPTSESQTNHKPITNQEKQPEVGYFQAWINFWKNSFKFYTPHRTDRREFTLNFIMGFIFVVAVLSCLYFSEEAVFWLLLIV